MTAPATLVDPQLAAFFAADPGQLRPPPTPAPERSQHKELELAIAAAVLVAVKVVRDRLSARHQTVDTARDAARQEWHEQMPLWLRLVVPAILRAFTRNGVGAGMAADQLTAVATSYAEALGQYVGDSSADALQAGLQEQLNNHWDDRLSWQRAAAAFGVDNRDMRSYLRQMLVGTESAPTELIAPVAIAFRDRAVLNRADRIGSSESWTAVETGKALAWMYLQRLGQLPDEALREWDTAEDESTCQVCAPMDGSAVQLDQPFTVQGRNIWAPQAHPGCRCHVRLVVPEEPVEKAWTPEESREHPTGAGHRFVRKPVRVRPVLAERERVVDPVVQEMLEQVHQIPDAPTLAPLPALAALPELAPPLAPPLAPLPRLSGQLAPRLRPLLAPGQLNAQLQTPEQISNEWKRRRTVRYNTVVIFPPKAPPKRRGDVYYVDADKYNRATNHPIGDYYYPNETIDFSRAQREYQHGTVRADTALQPHWAVQKDSLRERHGITGEDAEDLENILDDQWSFIVDQALPLVDKAIGRNPGTGEIDLKQPRHILSNLTDGQLRDIGIAAGRLQPYAADDDGAWDREQMERDILTDIAKLEHNEDDGLAEAYIDAVVWQDPHLIFGTDLIKAMEAAREYKIAVGAAPLTQVFSFDTNTARQPDVRQGAIVPTGDYQIYRVRYHSGLWTMEDDLKFMPLAIGAQELQMMPLEVRGGKWRAKE